MSKKKPTGDPPEGIPAWIVSFTDMVTLLLAFFVLLQSFAHEQSPELFAIGQGSFKKAIQGMGIPRWLYGIKTMGSRSFLIKRHASEPDDRPRQQDRPDIIDAEEEQIQRAFQSLKKNMDSTSSDLGLKTIRVIATPIRFASGGANVTSSARAYLDSLAVLLRDNLPSGSTDVYVIGLAPKASASQKGWITSARRAEMVAKYLRKKLRGTKTKWSLHSWGAGRRYGNIPDGTQAGIVVMGAHDGG